MTAASLRTYLLSRVPLWLCALPVMTGAGAWLSADDARPITMQLFLLVYLAVLPSAAAASLLHTPARPLERTLPIALPLHEAVFVVGWSVLAMGCVLVVLALPDRDTFIVDRIEAGDWIGNIAAFTGLVLAWCRWLPSRLAWAPGLVWATGAIIGALPELESSGVVPVGAWWWPVADATDTEARWIKLILCVSGCAIFFLPSFPTVRMLRRSRSASPLLTQRSQRAEESS